MINGPVWLAGWQPGRRYWWGDRSAALAAQCTTLSWGPQPQAWVAAATLPNLAGTTAAGDPDTCPVCLEPFADPLPAALGGSGCQPLALL